MKSISQKPKVESQKPGLLVLNAFALDVGHSTFYWQTGGCV